MKQNDRNLLYHLVAFITVAIWGTTFVSTKVLMLNGLSPHKSYAPFQYCIHPDADGE